MHPYRQLRAAFSAMQLFRAQEHLQGPPCWKSRPSRGCENLSSGEVDR